MFTINGICYERFAGNDGDKMLKSVNDKMGQLLGKGSKDLVNGSNLPLLFSGNNLNWRSNNRQMSVPPPRPLVICGPSGSGKSTLLKQLLDEFGENFGFSVSHTTRKPRPGEVNGRDYYFVEREEMEEAINNGGFIEFTEFSGNMYGTSKKAVRDVQEQGRICILDIEIEGVKSMKKTDLNPHYVFIKPPSMDALEERLRGRGTESEESINKRLKKAREEMAYGETQGNFDLVLVNDDVTETYKDLRGFLHKDIEALKKS